MIISYVRLIFYTINISTHNAVPLRHAFPFYHRDERGDRDANKFRREFQKKKKKSDFSFKR